MVTELGKFDENILQYDVFIWNCNSTIVQKWGHLTSVKFYLFVNNELIVHLFIVAEKTWFL